MPIFWRNKNFYLFLQTEKNIVMEKRNLTRTEALERLQKSINAKKYYIKETRVALENEYMQRFGVKPSNYNVW